MPLTARSLKFGVFPQFVGAAAATALVSIGLLAHLLSGIAKDAMLRNTADEGTALITFFIGPIAQELATSSTFSPKALERLDELSKNELRARVLLIKIWTPDRVVAYSTNKSLIGRQLPTTRHHRVMRGEIIATFDDLHDAKVDFGHEPEMPLIEVYAPIEKTGTRDIIAVGELYFDGEPIASEARSIMLTTIVVVLTVTLPMAFILFLFVYKANVATLDHRYALNQKIQEAEALARQNDRLRRIAEDARLSVARSNEQLLGRLGQDIHDGPVQLLSLLMLKASGLIGDENRPSGAISVATNKLQQLIDLISQVLAEIRALSHGLVLPELQNLSVEDTLRLAIKRHEDTTGSDVTFHASNLPADAPLPIRICLYRVVQEGLNNAFLHAGGRGQEVQASTHNGNIEVLVLDSGLADPAQALSHPKSNSGLGLRGLRTRVEGFQGTFEIRPRTGGGTVLKATVPCSNALAPKQAEAYY